MREETDTSLRRNGSRCTLRHFLVVWICLPLLAHATFDCTSVVKTFTIDAAVTGPTPDGVYRLSGCTTNIGLSITDTSSSGNLVRLSLTDMVLTSNINIVTANRGVTVNIQITMTNINVSQLTLNLGSVTSGSSIIVTYSTWSTLALTSTTFGDNSIINISNNNATRDVTQSALRIDVESVKMGAGAIVIANSNTISPTRPSWYCSATVFFAVTFGNAAVLMVQDNMLWPAAASCSTQFNLSPNFGGDAQLVINNNSLRGGNVPSFIKMAPQFTSPSTVALYVAIDLPASDWQQVPEVVWNPYFPNGVATSTDSYVSFDFADGLFAYGATGPSLNTTSFQTSIPQANFTLNSVKISGRVSQFSISDRGQLAAPFIMSGSLTINNANIPAMTLIELANITLNQFALTWTTLQPRVVVSVTHCTFTSQFLDSDTRINLYGLNFMSQGTVVIANNTLQYLVDGNAGKCAHYEVNPTVNVYGVTFDNGTLTLNDNAFVGAPNASILSQCAVLPSRGLLGLSITVTLYNGTWIAKGNTFDTGLSGSSVGVSVNAQGTLVMCDWQLSELRGGFYFRPYGGVAKTSYFRLTARNSSIVVATTSALPSLSIDSVPVTWDTSWIGNFAVSGLVDVVQLRNVSCRSITVQGQISANGTVVVANTKVLQPSGSSVPLAVQNAVFNSGSTLLITNNSFACSATPPYCWSAPYQMILFASTVFRGSLVVVTDNVFWMVNTSCAAAISTPTFGSDASSSYDSATTLIVRGSKWSLGATNAYQWFVQSTFTGTKILVDVDFSTAVDTDVFFSFQPRYSFFHVQSFMSIVASSRWSTWVFPNGSCIPTQLVLAPTSSSSSVRFLTLSGGLLVTRSALQFRREQLFGQVSFSSTVITVPVLLQDSGSFQCRQCVLLSMVDIRNCTGTIDVEQTTLVSMSITQQRGPSTVTYYGVTVSPRGRVLLLDSYVDWASFRSMQLGNQSQLVVARNVFNASTYYQRVYIDNVAGMQYVLSVFANVFGQPDCYWVPGQQLCIVLRNTAVASSICIFNNSFLPLPCDVTMQAISLAGDFTGNSVVSIAGTFEMANRGLMLNLGVTMTNATLIVDVSTPFATPPRQCGGVSINAQGLLNADSRVRVKLCDGKAYFYAPVPFPRAGYVNVGISPTASLTSSSWFGTVSSSATLDRLVIQQAGDVNVNGGSYTRIDVINSSSVGVSYSTVVDDGRLTIVNCTATTIIVQSLTVGLRANVTVVSNTLFGTTYLDRILVTNSFLGANSTLVIDGNSIMKPWWYNDYCPSGASYIAVTRSTFADAARLFITRNIFMRAVPDQVCRDWWGIFVSSNTFRNSTLVIQRNNMSVNDTNWPTLNVDVNTFLASSVTIDVETYYGGILFRPNSQLLPSYVRIVYGGWVALLVYNAVPPSALVLGANFQLTVNGGTFAYFNVTNVVTFGAVTLTGMTMAAASTLLLASVSAQSIWTSNNTLLDGAQFLLVSCTVSDAAFSNNGPRVKVDQWIVVNGASIVLSQSLVAQVTSPCPTLKTPAILVSQSNFINGSFLCVTGNTVTPVTTCSSATAPALSVSQDNTWSLRSALMIDSTNNFQTGTQGAAAFVDGPTFLGSWATCLVAGCSMTTASGSVMAPGEAPTQCPRGANAPPPLWDPSAVLIAMPLVDTSAEFLPPLWVNNSTSNCSFVVIAPVWPSSVSRSLSVTVTNIKVRRRITASRTRAAPSRNSGAPQDSLPPTPSPFAPRQSRSHARTLSRVRVTRTVAMSQNRTSGPTPAPTSSHLASPAPTQANRANLTTLLSAAVSPLAALGLSEATATAVEASTQSALGIAGAFSPTAANKAATTARLASASNCNANNGVQVPNQWQLLPALPLSNPNGDTDNAVAAGMVASTTILVVLNVVALVLWAKLRSADGVEESTSASMLASVHGICFSYLGPNILATSVSLLQQDNLTTKERAVSTLGAVAVCCVFAVTLWACALQPPGAVAVAPQLHRQLGRIFLRFYEAARDLNSWYIRLHTLEDVGVAHAMALISSVTLPSSAACRGLSIIMTIVAAAHLAYVLGVRPLAPRLDRLLAVANAGITCSVAALYNIISFVPDSTGAQKALAVALLGTDAFYFAQAALLLGVALMAILRPQKSPRPAAASSTKGSQGHEMTAVPLLQLHTAVDKGVERLQHNLAEVAVPPTAPLGRSAVPVVNVASTTDSVMMQNPLGQL